MHSHFVPWPETGLIASFQGQSAVHLTSVGHDAGDPIRIFPIPELLRHNRGNRQHTVWRVVAAEQPVP